MAATVASMTTPTNQVGTGTEKAPSSPGPGYSLECDYDANPSFLYQALEAKQWDYALKFFGKPEGFVQAATWVTRKEKNGMLRWRILPIHAAIIFGAPVKVIQLLLKEFPAGAQQKDDQGMLPIHLAFRNDATCIVLEELLTVFPQGVSVKDRKGRTPLECVRPTSKPLASVLELYAQIVVANERQLMMTESLSTVDTRIAAIQEQHITTLTNLKEEWESQHEAMEKEVSDAKKALEHTALRLQEAQVQLNQKTQLEAELTHKLGMVTMALQSVNSSRATESAYATPSSPRSPRSPLSSAGLWNNKDNNDSNLRAANDELLKLVRFLMDQQMELKSKLDRQTHSINENAMKKAAMLQELDDLNRVDEEKTSLEREDLRRDLAESNDHALLKLRSIMQLIDGTAPQASPWF